MVVAASEAGPIFTCSNRRVSSATSSSLREEWT